MPLTAEIKINTRTIWFVQINNDGTGDEEVGSYDAYLSQGVTRSLGATPDAHVRIEEFRRERGAVALVGIACTALAQKLDEL